MVEVNAEIRALATRLDPWGEHEWEFCCECGDENCSETVGTSLVEFDEGREAARPLLASGHFVSRAQTARAQSEALCDSAAALKAQARQQFDRARRLERG